MSKKLKKAAQARRRAKKMAAKAQKRMEHKELLKGGGAPRPRQTHNPVKHAEADCGNPACKKCYPHQVQFVKLALR